MSVISKEDMRRAFQQRHGKDLQEKLEETTVAICGLGGLGSNMAILLARTGIGKLILLDFDKVDLSNLHRQQYKLSQIGKYKSEAIVETLKEIAPYTDYKSYVEKLGEENCLSLLSEADIICEAFDDANAKAMLVNFVLEHMPEKYLIAASGMGGMEDANLIKTKKISEHFYLCGDNKSEVKEGTPLFASRVAVCAAHQAHKVIQLVDEKMRKARL